MQISEQPGASAPDTSTYFPLEPEWERRWIKLLAELTYLTSSGAFVSEGELTERLEGVIYQDETESYYRSKIFACLCLLAAENVPPNLLPGLIAQSFRRVSSHTDTSTRLAVERVDHAVNQALLVLEQQAQVDAKGEGA